MLTSFFTSVTPPSTLTAALASLGLSKAPANDGSSHGSPAQQRQTRMFRASDDSMQGCGIHSGDMLVINQKQQARSGDIVLLQLNGRLQIRRLCLLCDEMLLLTENPAFLPRYVLNGDACELLGVVVSRLQLSPAA